MSAAATDEPNGAADERPGLGAKQRWTIRGGYYAIVALAATWRRRVVNREAVDALRARKEPIIFAFWHGQMLPLLYQHRDEGVAILISSHRDGELIAQVAHRLGYRTVRGSSSRGAGRALLGMVRELEAGGEVAVTPDGPRGPAERFASGALVAAQRAGAYIVPVGVSVDRAWRLRSWDRFLVPKPFARVTCAYGPPTKVLAASARDASAEAERFGRLLSEARDLAGASHEA